MLFATLILISVDCKHDGLEQSINLGHGNESTEMSNVAWFGLEEEEQISVLLRLLVVGEEAFL